MRYTAQISESSLSTLEELIERSIFLVYAPCLQVGGQDFTAPSFSIPISDEIDGKWSHRYVVVQCEWHETPKTLTDYWQLLVSEESKPHGIEVNSENAIVAPCTIHFWKAKPIERIEIYSYDWAAGDGDNSEEVNFDQAIRIWSEDGWSLCVACQLDGPGIATEVPISEDPRTIADYLKESKCRLVLPRDLNRSTKTT